MSQVHQSLCSQNRGMQSFCSKSAAHTKTSLFVVWWTARGGAYAVCYLACFGDHAMGWDAVVRMSVLCTVLAQWSGARYEQRDAQGIGGVRSSPAQRGRSEAEPRIARWGSAPCAQGDTSVKGIPARGPKWQVSREFRDRR
jgi:hypothetical protein